MQRELGSLASVTHRQTKWPPALWPRAPGSRPARVSTWNPLQMPITGRPDGDEVAQRLAEVAAVAVADVEGEQPSGAEGVAVAEPAGDRRRGRPRRRGRGSAVNSSTRTICGVGAGQLEGEHGVAVAVGARARRRRSPWVGMVTSRSRRTRRSARRRRASNTPAIVEHGLAPSPCRARAPGRRSP